MGTRHWYQLAAACLAAISAASSPASARIPVTLTQHGWLEQFGEPVDGEQPMTFNLYRDVAQAVPLWTETRTVTVVQGYYSVVLGTLTALDAEVLGEAADLHLGIRVGSDLELSPRLPVTSVPYALAAETAVTAQVAADVDCTACVGATEVGFTYAGSAAAGGAALGLECSEQCVQTAEIENGAIITAKLQDSGVTTAKLANASVTLAKLAACSEGDLLRYKGSGGWQCTPTVRLARRVHLTTSGIYYPAFDVAAILVGVCGATGGKSIFAAGGVGGAGYAERYITELASSYTVTIGAGGIGGNEYDIPPPSAGGVTAFGGLMSVTSSGLVNSDTGSAGGVSSGGALNANGGRGGNGAAYTAVGGSGAGGGRSGPGGNGGNRSGSTPGGGGGTGGLNAVGTTPGGAATSLHPDATPLVGADRGYLEDMGYSFSAGAPAVGASGVERINYRGFVDGTLPGCPAGQEWGAGQAGAVTIIEILRYHMVFD